MGWLLTWPVSLHHFFLFPENLALPVSILNLPRVQKKKSPSWDRRPFCLTSVTHSSLFTLLHRVSSQKLFCFFFQTYSLTVLGPLWPPCVLSLGQLPCYCFRLNTGSRLCKQQPKQVKLRPARGKTASPSSLPQRSD